MLSEHANRALTVAFRSEDQHEEVEPRVAKGLSMLRGGWEILIGGRLVRIARRTLDRYDSVDDPASLVGALRASNMRAGLFVFMQKLPLTSPRARAQSAQPLARATTADREGLIALRR